MLSIPLEPGLHPQESAQEMAIQILRRREGIDKSAGSSGFGIEVMLDLLKSNLGTPEG